MSAIATTSSAKNDEQQIREWVATWIRASEAEDLPTLLNLLAEDVVFLIAGRPIMQGREAFAAASRSMHGKVKVKVQSDIKEIKIFGDLAYTWTQLAVTVAGPVEGAPKRHSGNTLSIFRKLPSGSWVLSRDANMLSVEN